MIIRYAVVTIRRSDSCLLEGGICEVISLGYVVYVNHPNNKAIVHDETCSKYTNRRRNQTHNGFWTEPFESFEEAMKFAKTTGKRRTDTCALCIRD